MYSVTLFVTVSWESETIAAILLTWALFCYLYCGTKWHSFARYLPCWIWWWCKNHSNFHIQLNCFYADKVLMDSRKTHDNVQQLHSAIFIVCEWCGKKYEWCLNVNLSRANFRTCNHLWNNEIEKEQLNKTNEWMNLYALEVYVKSLWKKINVGKNS